MKTSLRICLLLTSLMILLAGCARDVEIIKVRRVEQPEKLATQARTIPGDEPQLAGWVVTEPGLADGLNYYEADQYDRCRKVAENYLVENPSGWQGHYLLSMVEFQGGNFAAAERCLQTTLRFSPADSKIRAMVYLALGQTLERQGKTGPSKQHYLTALNLDPGLLPARDGIDRLTSLTSAGDR